MLTIVAVLLTFSGGEAVRVLGAGAAGASGASGASGAAPYVTAGQAAVLECRFVLETREVLQGVTWTKDSHLVYRWLPSGRTLAFGPLEGLTEVSEPGWNVRLSRATTAMAGNYSCSVHTDRGSAASRRFRFNVLLVCKARIETEDSTAVNCTVGWRVSCARVFPDLNLTAGVFDPTENKFIDRVTEWTKVVYSDNTFGFHAFKSYHVAEIPKSSVFLWSLSYQDQTPLVTGNVSSGAVHRAWSGCSEPPALPAPRDASLQLQLLYDGAGGVGVAGAGDGGAQADCRGRPRGATRAVYSCANEIPDGDPDGDAGGAASSQAGGQAGGSTKELVCANGEWVEEDPSAPWPVC